MTPKRKNGEPINHSENDRTSGGDDLLFGRAGAEALFDRSEYEPANPAPPSQIRGRPSKERASRRSRRFETADQEAHNGIPDPHNFTESQMDRQDAMADFDDADVVQGIHSDDVAEPKKPIVIDLRNVGDSDDYAGSWLQLKDRRRDK